MSKGIVIRPEACIGCKSCELVCAFNRTGCFSAQSSAVHVYSFSDEAVVFPLMCMQCEEPECAGICPTGALSREENVILYDNHKCIRCGKCTVACPLGNIHSDVDTGRMVKCDLCAGKVNCVDICPVGAIDYMEINENVEKCPIGSGR